MSLLYDKLSKTATSYVVFDVERLRGFPNAYVSNIINLIKNITAQPIL